MNEEFITHFRIGTELYTVIKSNMLDCDLILCLNTNKTIGHFRLVNDHVQFNRFDSIHIKYLPELLKSYPPASALFIQNQIYNQILEFLNLEFDQDEFQAAITKITRKKKINNLLNEIR